VRHLLLCLLLAVLSSPARAAGEFTWPLGGWLTATDHYRWGVWHNGSADLAAPYWTPVTAAADGVVSGIDDASCHSLSIDHGDGWATFYCHLVRTPSLHVGQGVRAGQLVGHVGRHGYASIPHLHFAIVHNGVRQAIPGIAAGTWVRRGDVVPGDYPGVVARTPRRFRFRVRAIVDELTVLAEPLETAAVVGEVRQGSSLRVEDAFDGFYRVRRTNIEGWIPMSGVAPARGGLVDLEIGPSSLDVHAEPEDNSPVVGSVPAGTLLPAFAVRSAWFRILVGYPAQYGWIGAEEVVTTEAQRVAIAAVNAVVRSGPGPEFGVLGTLDQGTYYNIRVVRENRNGWLRTSYGNGWGWIPGWRTSGRI